MSQEIEEYKAYLISQGTSPDEANEYGEYLKSQQAEQVPQESGLKQKLMKALDIGARGLDYAGGVTRSAIAEGAGLLSGKDLIKDGEWKEAFKGNAPNSATIMERAGVPSGASLSELAPSMYSETGDGLPLQKGGWADPDARDAAGLAADIATDPLTYATFGASALGKAGKALKPVSNTLESTGKSIYKSGLKRIDQEALKYGKEPVSDLLMKYNISGSAGSIQKQMDQLAGDLVGKQKALLAQADQAGNVVDLNKAMAETDQLIAQIRASKDPMLQGVAQQLESEVKGYKALSASPASVTTKQVPSAKLDLSNPYQPKQLMEEVVETIPGRPGVTPSQASGFKTSVYESLPKGAFAENIAVQSGKHPQLLAGQKKIAKGLKESVEDASSGLQVDGLDLKQLNEQLGRVLTTKDKQMAEAFKEANKNLFTSVDGMIAGSQNPWMFAFKKAADVAKMTGPRTTVGKGMSNLGRGALSGPALDVLARELAKEAKQEDK